MNVLDRVISWIAPGWGQQRARARLLARHYESVTVGRRTNGFPRLLTDANAAAAGATLIYLRAQARDIVRNNGWARRGLRRILSDTVGAGIRPKPSGRGADLIAERWKAWAETTECDAAGMLTFYGLQRLAMRTIVESGEVLIRRRTRREEDGLSVPLQIQVLEPDYIDTNRDGVQLDNGGEIIQGVEYDAIGRRVAYWLFNKHPGSIHQLTSPVSKRYPADGILHVFDVERAGQTRGPSWFASVDMRFHDFANFEDATLQKQIVAACLAAFVTDLDGMGSPLAKAGTDQATGQPTDRLEPGMILPLQPGKQVTFSNPPASTDHQSYSATALRGIAAGLGTTYEDLTGDYSQLNYSSFRGARLAHQGDVEAWQLHMLIPQLCDPVFEWFVTTMILQNEDVDLAPAMWTAPPMPILDPQKEVQADKEAIRSGLKTWACAVRERGGDPDEMLEEMKEYNEQMDNAEIVLDSDPRHTNSAGQLQSPPPDPADVAGADASAKPGAAGSDGGDTTDSGESSAAH